MLTEERYDEILKLLKQKHAVTVIELTKLLNTSESTIRRDLNALAEMGKINKVHGGATAIEQSLTTEETFVVKAAKNMEQKNLIAQYAASMINDDDFVFLDAGTTTERMIDYLESTKAIFITNGMVHIRKLTQKGIKAYLLGGELKLSTEAMIGNTVVDNLRNYNFTKCFVGTNGIHKQYGFTTPDIAEAMIKKEALNRSFMSCVLADSSKFGIITPVTFGKLSQACIVTDTLNDKKYLDYTIIKEVQK